MRAILFTDELMGVALKFSKKSSTMGSLQVSWEPGTAINPSDSASSIKNSSSSSSSGSSNRKSFRRRLQTSISLCVATLFFTLLVFFFVCALDSSTTGRNLNPPSSSSPSSSSSSSSRSSSAAESRRAALQGLGTIFRRGTRSMSEMVIAHVAEDATGEELGLFLRALHRSGVGARADIVLIFPGDPRESGLASVVEQENQNYHNLLAESGCFASSIPLLLSLNDTESSEVSSAASSSSGPCCSRGASNADSSSSSSSSPLLLSNCSMSRLNLEVFARAEEENRARAEAGLARLLKSNRSVSGEEMAQWLAAANRNSVPLGSIMGFDVAELDPLDTLSGFVDRPPIQLRRWLCYQMLLGMAKQHHRYKQVLIAQVRGVFVFGDSLLAMARRHRDSRALILVTEDRTWLEDSTITRKIQSGIREILSEDEEEADENEESEASSKKRPNSSSGSGSDSPKRKRQRQRRRKLGLIEEVYGRHVWGSIEREDKAGWAVVSSAVVAGGTRAVRSLADAVATEAARAAMMRRSRAAFGDQAALNYVVRRNVNVLGRKVVEQIVYVDGGAGSRGAARVLRGAPGGTVRRFDVVVAADEEARSDISVRVLSDLCSSPRESSIYADCQQQQQQDKQEQQQQQQ